MSTQMEKQERVSGLSSTNYGYAAETESMVPRKQTHSVTKVAESDSHSLSDSTESSLLELNGQKNDRTNFSPPGQSLGQRQLGLFADWWIELVTMITGIAFLGAVIIVLLKVHDTPLTDWSGPFGVQPTTLIAVMVKLCKLFLLLVVTEALSQLKWVYFERRQHYLYEIEHFDSAS